MSKPVTLKEKLQARIRNWIIAAACWTAAAGLATAAVIIISMPPAAIFTLLLLAGYSVSSAIVSAWMAYRGYRLLHHPLFYVAAIQHDLSDN